MRRPILILLGAITLVGLLVFVVAPALGQEDTRNQVEDWCSDNQGIKVEPLTGPSFTVPEPPEGTTWTLLVIKSGTTNEEIPFPQIGWLYVPSNGKEPSHAILCYETSGGSTTSSTTSSTVPASSTSSTVPASSTSTTTTDPTTTTSSSVPNSTTSTTSPESSSTTSTSEPSVSSTVPQSTTTEIPPPTLIESGDAGYLGEEDDGHEHEDEGAGLAVLLAAGLVGILLGALIVLTLNAVRYRNQ